MSINLRNAAPTGVYLLTADMLDTAWLLARTRAALAAGIGWLQYRNKLASVALRREQAHALRQLTRAHRARLIVNDDARLAVEVQADGVHLGRDDGDLTEVRTVVGTAATIGVSGYDDFERARRVWQTGADYVAFGAMFASAVKPEAVRAPLALLSRARAAGMHVVAIGGIDAENIGRVAAAGAQAAALISAVYDASDPGAAAARLVAAFAAGRETFTHARAHDEHN